MSEAERKARLAEALRANLRKRKAQAREQASREHPVEERESESSEGSGKPT